MKKIAQTLLILLLIPIINFGQDFQLDFKPKKIRKRIRKIANKIGKKNEIHSAMIGYELKRTNQYNRFEKLIKQATIEELVELMEHPKPAVRGYVFWALAKKYYADLEEIFVSHANDEEMVFQIEGCLGGEIPVIEFMRWVVMPQALDADCKKLKDSSFKKVNAIRN